MTQRHNTMQIPNTTATEQTQLQVVMNYAAELELEVDRLRNRDQFLQQEARDHIRQTASLCRQAGQSQNEEKALRAVVEACDVFDKLLRDLHEPPGYHPSCGRLPNKSFAGNNA